MDPKDSLFTCGFRETSPAATCTGLKLPLKGGGGGGGVLTSLEAASHLGTKNERGKRFARSLRGHVCQVLKVFESTCALDVCSEVFRLSYKTANTAVTES